MNTSSPSPIHDLLNLTLVFCNDCLNRQDFPAAWQSLSRALRLSPKSASLRVHRGRLALFLDDAENAAQDFAEALRLEPHCAAAHSGLARLFFRYKKTEEAEQMADRALSLDSADEEAKQVKAECAAGRAGPRAGSTSDYYRVPASCPIAELGALYDHFFSQRTNGMLVEWGWASGEDGIFTQALADVGWRSHRFIESTPERDQMRSRQIEPCFEVLCVKLGGGECGLLSSVELNYWRPQLLILTSSGDAFPGAADAMDDLYSAQYFQEHQYLPVYQNGRHTIYAAREKLLARRSRMECLLIWGHGIGHWENILDRIRARAALEIVAIHRRPTGDMTKFVQNLYACDTVPFEHLRAKTRYLLNTPGEVIAILLRNLNAQERSYGEGAFQHIQCALIKDLKEEVRNAWNPRVNGKRSEDHVIHATDYDSQVVHTLKLLGLPPVEHYQRRPNRDYDLPYHLEPFSKCREMELPLDSIRARILGQGVVPIDQTPHFRFVAGEREPYVQYFSRHFGKELSDDHSAAAFDRLIKNFEYGRVSRDGKPSLLLVRKVNGIYLLQDGVHRASILRHRGMSTVRVLEMLPELEVSAAFFSPSPSSSVALPPPVGSGQSVVVKLQGGLGNQMFQYAAGLALARRTGAQLKLDLSFLLDRTPRANFTFRDFDLDLFDLPADCEVVKKVSAQSLERLTVFREKHFHFDSRFPTLGADSYLDGYWQSSRYFAEIADEVRRTFTTFRSPLAPATQALVDIVRSQASVCLNVRRGDYVSNAATGAFHGVCGLEYFRAAVRYIRHRIPDAYFYIFSDDAEWCAKVDLTDGAPSTIIGDEHAGERFSGKFRLMTACRHFIVPNSSFGWWAAFLGQTVDSVVVAPTPWFNDLSIELADLLPARWTQLTRVPGPIPSQANPTPTVSVVVPCYKQAHFLQEAVESVVAQTFSDWELIVVNDGSPDDTSRVTEELKARHPERRIRLLEKANGGLASARNAGIAIAAGKYILPLDSDDRIHPRMLEKTVKLLETHPDVAIAYVDQRHFSEENREVQVIEYDFGTLIRANFIAYCSLYRKEAWAKVHGYRTDVPGYEDWDFWISCGENRLFGKRVPELLFYYRRRAGSMLAAAKSLDHELRSQIILHHPHLYSEQERTWAAKVGGTKRESVGRIMGNANDESRSGAMEAESAGVLCGRNVLIYTDDPGQGGAAHYNHALLEALVEAGAHVFCAQPQGDNRLAVEQAKIGVQHCWTAYNPVVDFGRSFVDEEDAFRIFEQTKPDLVYFSDCCAFSHIAAKKAAIDLRIPFVVICHSEATYLAERFARFLPAVKEQLGQASAVIGVSGSSLDVMRRYFGLAADKGQVIYNGCAESYFAPVDPANRGKLRTELKIPADAVLCFTAARLDAGKCHQLQLEAICRLRDSGRLGALHFAWAGEGDLRAKLEQSVRALKLEDRVHILGYRWDVRDLMGAADIFILTTLYEAMPLCVLEAMARGLPVIASSVGGIPEELGDTGILLPDPNVDPRKTIAGLMDSLMELSANAERRHALGAAAKSRARELFRGSGTTQATLAVIRQALASKAANESAASEEIFGPDEVRMIEQLCAAYASKSAEAEISSQLQSLQQGLMNFLVTARAEKLEAGFRGNFGRVFRALAKSGLPFEAPTEESRTQLAVLDEALAASQEGKAFDYRPLLARMILAPAHRGSITIVPEKVPAWFLDDYLGYVLHAPQVFVIAGEAEAYHAHMLVWVRAIVQRIGTAPNAPLTVTLASFFATKSSQIPLYFSGSNTLELSEKRGTILEFFLRKAGAAIDARLPRRPKHRKRIKIGYVSAHFGAQTETHVTLPALQLDPSRFEICLFPVSNNPGPIEDYCRSFADSFTPLPKDLAQQVKTIRNAALDVVIIGTNVTAVTNRVALLALHRLAPLQLATYCSPVSTGMRHVDGYLSGSYVDTPGLRAHFSEDILLCDGPPGCLDYTVEAEASAGNFDRARFGLAADEVVFVNAAACYKILPEMQETWAKILKAVPKSRLLLLPFNPNWATAFPARQFEQVLTEVCARHGVSRDRFILVDALPSRADVKALEQVADVYLDTFPFSGSISVIDPLELGIPPVVREGETHRSRMAAALLRELDIPELIVTDEPAYIALAVKLANDPAFRRRMEERILAGMSRKPRFVNPRAYAEGLGALIESRVTGKKRSELALTTA